MKTVRILALALLLGVSGTLFAGNENEPVNQAQKWKVDKSHSGVNFAIRHFFTPVNGTFDDFSAEIYFDPANLAGSSISATIKVASVNTKNDNRDKHLQTADFFEAEKWPTMTFVSSSIAKTGDNTFVAKGKLTIKQTVVDFELPFTLLGTLDNPRPNIAKLAAMSSSFRILRNAFGVGTGNYVETKVIGDEVDVTINLELLSDN